MHLHENAKVETALATIGAVLWSIQIIPQIIKSYRTKDTHGLSGLLMLLWAIASLFLGSYIVAERLSIPLQIQPQIFGFFAGVSWCQCLHYTTGYSALKSCLFFLGYLVIFAGFETGSIYALRVSISVRLGTVCWADAASPLHQKGVADGTTAPELAYGYIAAALLAGALLPQYFEIYKLKEVRGISLTFMAVDILGGVFSFLSLFFRAKLDVAAFVSYFAVVILDGIVVILAFILNPIAKRRREREARLDEEAQQEPSPGAFESAIQDSKPQVDVPLASVTNEKKSRDVPLVIPQ
ncbi:hypothetical protein P7C73_g1464, partial [Tremellales sp. Uapishka_1]